jgi:adenylosuccinate synthase
VLPKLIVQELVVPFPTELHDATGEELRKIGSEFGATIDQEDVVGLI